MQLATLLRQLRENAGITQSEAGRLLPHKRPQNKLARLEHGECGLTAASLDDLLSLYRVSDPDVIDLARQLNTKPRQRGRWTGARSVYDQKDRRYVDLEEDAQLIREVCVEHVPELLRCESYLRETAYSELTGKQAEALRSRQRAVLDSGAQVYAVLSESAVRRIPGGATVRRAQINHLLALSQNPSVHLRIVPFCAVLNTRIWLENFILLRLRCPGIIDELGLDFAYTRRAGELVGVDGRIDDYETMWMNITNAAPGPRESRRILRTISRNHAP